MTYQPIDAGKSGVAPALACVAECGHCQLPSERTEAAAKVGKKQGDFDNTLSNVRGKVDATHALRLQEPKCGWIAAVCRVNTRKVSGKSTTTQGDSDNTLSNVRGRISG